jgi:ankyrin repeat protein
MRGAARMLTGTPDIAVYGFGPAVVLGDAGLVATELERAPTLATRTDPRTGWTALHAACASRWHQIEPARTQGLADVAGLLIDAGADPVAFSSGRRRWRPLRCAIAVSNTGGSNRPLVELLLDHGAVPDDHDVYLAGFANDCHQLLPVLLARVPNPREVIEQALAAPISNDDARSARLLLEAGADPACYRDDDGQRVPVLWAAAEAGCHADLFDLLLAHKADPDATGPDGRTAYQVVTAAGRTELADLCRRHGVSDSATDVDRFLSACRRADRAEAQQQLDDDPGLLDRLSEDDRSAIVEAAQAGETAAVALMLDVGFPLDARGDFGGTTLHAAAYSGSAAVVEMLLDRGADIGGRDSNWQSTPLDWAMVGSGERPRSNPKADWAATVQMLLDRGASTAAVTLDPNDDKPPSPEVAELLIAHLARAGGS